MNQTVAVVVTYNRKELLAGCISHLLEQTAPCDILVIDNASTDGTQEYIGAWIDNCRVFYHNTGANLGGAGGFRAGMELAVRRGYSQIWIMDDDTFPQTDALEVLLAADRSLNGQYGFLSSAAYWIDGSLCNMNRQRTSLTAKVEDYESPAVRVVMATFVSFFLRVETVRAFGLPISEFFIWADDLEYSRRISRALPCYLIPGSKVEHRMGSNQKVGIEQESADRLWRYEYLYRNEVYVFRREGLNGYGYLFSRLALHLLRILIKGKNDKVRKLQVVLTSFIRGFQFHPQPEFVEDAPDTQDEQKEGGNLP